MSLEVAEHLEADKADGFVKYLTGCSDAIMFSAAVPGQGGTHHVNEQSLSYWVEKFDSGGFQLFDVIRPIIWNDRRIAWWYRQNIVCFARRGSEPHMRLSQRLNETQPLVDVAHPEGFFFKPDPKTRFWHRPRYTLQRDLRALRRRLVGGASK